MRLPRVRGNLSDDRFQVACSTFNARAETISTTATFRDPWKKGQRCLVITDGFYEWRKSGVGDKHPFAIGMADDSLMTFAGLWEDWQDKASGELVRSCTIITTEPNATIVALHDRMPVILEEAQWPRWLGDEPATEAELMGMLKSCADDLIKVWPVSKAVGNVRNNGPELAEPVDEGELLI